MYRKLSLVLVALIFIMAAFCLPVFAEPQEDESDISSSYVQDSQDDESSEVSNNDDDETSSKKNNSSKKNSSKESEKESSHTSKYYIPDDSTYFTESLNSLGGNVTSGSITLDDNSTVSQETPSQSPPSVERFSLQDVLKRFLWIPIVIIIICILVLIIFNKIYELKYKHIDPKVLLKEQKKADKLKREARHRSQEDEEN
ncbi:MAG: hypothetical protein IKV36_03840 [Clostridia bacterium]|nr:hypothetical protein [Clostridia bacterium]